MGVQDVILSMGKLIIPTAIRVLKHVLLLVGLILLWGLSTYVGLAPDIEEVLSIPVWTLMWMVGKCFGVLVVIVIILGGIYVYVSYNKVRNDLKGIEGIPMPELGHQIYGHPQYLIHHFRHHFRLQLFEKSPNVPVMQFVLPGIKSVFINSAVESGFALQDYPTKGPSYALMRLNAKIPDLLTADGEAWKQRHSILGPSLQSLSLGSSQRDDLLQDLTIQLRKHSESGEPLDILRCFSNLAVDAVSTAALGFSLVKVFSKQMPDDFVDALDIMACAGLKTGMFKPSNLRPTTDEDIERAKMNMTKILQQVSSLVLNRTEEWRSIHGEELDTKGKLSHALVALHDQAIGNAATAAAGATAVQATGASSAEGLGLMVMKSEIYQLFKHAQEMLGGQLAWTFYVLMADPSWRLEVERAILAAADAPDDSDKQVTATDMLHATVKECMRRYPVTGNLVKRCVTGENCKISETYDLPPGTSLHMHIYSMHNCSKPGHWGKDALKFEPRRWLKRPTDAQKKATEGVGRPTCPFLRKGFTTTDPPLATRTDKEDMQDYHGMGFQLPGQPADVEEQSGISFLPFSVGPRACPARGMVVDFIVDTLRHMMQPGKSGFRFDMDPRLPPNTEGMNPNLDPGKSLNSCLVPYLESSIKVLVTCGNVGEEGAVPKPPKQKDEEEDDGWADE